MNKNEIIEKWSKKITVATSRSEEEVEKFANEMGDFLLSFYTKEELIASNEIIDEFNNLCYEYKNYISVDDWKEKLVSKFGPAETLIALIATTI